jgi:hypothetical protein
VREVRRDAAGRAPVLVGRVDRGGVRGVVPWTAEVVDRAAPDLVGRLPAGARLRAALWPAAPVAGARFRAGDEDEAPGGRPEPLFAEGVRAVPPDGRLRPAAPAGAGDRPDGSPGRGRRALPTVLPFPER